MSSYNNPRSKATAVTASHLNKGTTQLNYLREVEMHGVTLVLEVESSLEKGTVNNSKADRANIENDDDDDDDDDDNDDDDDDDDYDSDPMALAFDNMQHPMELMLLSRACIPFVAM